MREDRRLDNKDVPTKTVTVRIFGNSDSDNGSGEPLPERIAEIVKELSNQTENQGSEKTTDETD